MRKAWTILLTILIMVFILASCGKSALVGTWVTTIDGAEGQITLRWNGTGTVVSNDIPRPCTWEVTDGKLTVVQTIEENTFTLFDRVAYEVHRKTLTITSLEGNTLTLEKQ